MICAPSSLLPRHGMVAGLLMWAPRTQGRRASPLLAPTPALGSEVRSGSDAVRGSAASSLPGVRMRNAGMWEHQMVQPLGKTFWLFL